LEQIFSNADRVAAYQYRCRMPCSHCSDILRRARKSTTAVA
jgi:hypothetical protein